PTLAGELDEVGSLLGRLREEDALVRQDRDGVALDGSEAADESLAVELLELLQAASVDDARDDLAHVHLVAEVLGNEAVQIGRVDFGLLGARRLPRRSRRRIEVPDGLSRDRERVLVGGRAVVGDPGAAGMDGGAAAL